MQISTEQLRRTRDLALTVHSRWKQEIALCDLVANDKWQVMWPDKTVEESEPLVENIYAQALEDKTLSAGAMLPGYFVNARKGTRKDEAERNAQLRKRVHLSYAERSRLRRNLKRFYRDWLHAGAAYALPWTNWDRNLAANRFPFYMLLNPRQVFPIAYNSVGDLTAAVVMRQRPVGSLESDWGENHPAIRHASEAHKTARAVKAGWFEEVWYMDEDHWAVGLIDSQLPPEWQGSPITPAGTSTGGATVEWLKPPEEHGLQGCPIKEARRVTVDDSPRGALIDTVPSLKTAQNIMASVIADLHMTVHAPVVLDNIENADEYGMGAVLIGNGDGTANIIRDRPPVNFEAMQLIQQTLDRARHQAFEPEQRSGQAGASIVSAKGTNALMGTFNAELAAAQFDIETLIAEASSATANLDEVWCPGKKQIDGLDSGKMFDESYDPVTAFGGDYRLRVTYGDRTGLDEQNHLIRLATMKNLNAMSLRTFMEKAGISDDPLAEETDMAIERLTGLFFDFVLPQSIQAGDLGQIRAFVEKIDTDKVTVRQAVLDTIRETETPPAAGPGGAGGPDTTTPDVMRMVRSLDKGGIPGNAEGQPPSQVGLAPAVRRSLAQIGPGGTAT